WRHACASSYADRRLLAGAVVQQLRVAVLGGAEARIGLRPVAGHAGTDRIEYEEADRADAGPVMQDAGVGALREAGVRVGLAHAGTIDGADRLEDLRAESWCGRGLARSEGGGDNERAGQECDR